MNKKDYTYTAKVNDIFDFEMDGKGNLPCDILPLAQTGSYHILKDGKAYHAELVSANYDAKEFVIRVDGVEHHVRLNDHYDRLIQQMGLNTTASGRMNELKAPMPGLVLQVLVEPGQAVEKGDPLLILEAMKMENVIKATGNATVKNIPTVQGQAVEKGQLLMEME